MSLKTLGVIGAGLASVAGLCLIAAGRSSSLGELFEVWHANSPGSDKLESKLFYLRKWYGLPRFGAVPLPDSFDADLWLAQNWPVELAPYESWGKRAVYAFIEGEATLPAVMSALRANEMASVHKDITSFSQKTQQDVFEEMKGRTRS